MNEFEDVIKINKDGNIGIGNKKEMKLTFEELKQEFILSMQRPYLLTSSQIESQLTALLEAYDASKWLPYPENVPETGRYLVCGANDNVASAYYDADISKWSLNIQYWEVAAFRKLPKLFNPTEK